MIRSVTKDRTANNVNEEKYQQSRQYLYTYSDKLTKDCHLFHLRSLKTHIHGFISFNALTKIFFGPLSLAPKLN